jgi:hypothetical protein
MRLQAPQPLGEHHITTGFDCGDDRLNLWLQQRALGNQRSGATRTVVVCNADGAVKAYVGTTEKVKPTAVQLVSAIEIR